MDIEQIKFPDFPDCKGHYLLTPFTDKFSYTHDHGLLMALCSAASYEEQHRGEQIFKEAGFNKEIYFIENTNKNTQVYIIVYKSDNTSFAVIVFRGTDDMKDWMGNVKFFELFKKGILSSKPHSHPGFNKILGEVWEQIEIKVKYIQKKHKDIPIYLAGHSLGGALAILAALKLKDLTLDLETPAVITIGCPRVGNKSFIKQIGECIPVHRIVHASDVVPRVPPLLFGYRHVGTEHWLLPNGKEMTSSGNMTYKERLEWLNLAYNQSYHFKMYLAISVILGLLLSKLTYDKLDYSLHYIEALILGFIFAGIIIYTITKWVSPHLPKRIQRWFWPHFLTDHSSLKYVKELAERVEIFHKNNN